MKNTFDSAKRTFDFKAAEVIQQRKVNAGSDLQPIKAIVAAVAVQDMDFFLTGMVNESRRVGLGYAVVVQEFEKRYLTAQLRQDNWNQCKTARTLGMHRNTLNRKMHELGIPFKNPEKRSSKVEPYSVIPVSFKAERA